MKPVFLLSLCSAVCSAARLLDSEATSDECPSPLWVQFKNNCYSFVHATSGSLLGVGLARELCKDLGSDILSINTEEENNFLLTMFQTKWNGPNEILLGMFYDSDDDALKWFDTSELTYKNFKEGAQVEMGLLTCAKMNTSTGRWDLVNCETFAQTGTLCKTKARKQKKEKQKDNRALLIILITSITLLGPLLSIALIVWYRRRHLSDFTSYLPTSRMSPYSDEMELVGGPEEDSS